MITIQLDDDLAIELAAILSEQVNKTLRARRTGVESLPDVVQGGGRRRIKGRVSDVRAATEEAFPALKNSFRAGYFQRKTGMSKSSAARELLRLVSEGKLEKVGAASYRKI